MEPLQKKHHFSCAIVQIFEINPLPKQEHCYKQREQAPLGDAAITNASPKSTFQVSAKSPR